MTEDAGIESGSGEPFGHLLGEFEIPDARRLLDRLEQANIDFELESEDQIENVGHRGSGGRWSKLKVWIHQTDQAEAERLQAEALNIQA